MKAVKIWVASAAIAFGGIAMASHANAEGPQEDEPGWSCVDDGNRVCGPGNSNGVPAGCYDDGGVLEASWPCHVEIDPETGDSDIYVDGDPSPVSPVYVY